MKLWHRKSKRHLLIISLVCFLLYCVHTVSKSLPEGSKKTVESESKQDKPSNEIATNPDEKAPVEAPDNTALVAQATQRFLDMYDLDWDNTRMSARESWNLAASFVNPRGIHPDYAPEIGSILSHIATSRFIHVGFGHRGTQLKLTVTLEGGQKVAFKPKWYERDYVVTGKPYDGHDRHNGEIAAFHLNRLMGYNRAPLVVGRRVSIKRDIVPVADQKLLDTFFYKNNNTCFLGRCLYCKTRDDAVCADGDTMEAAVVLWLPEKWSKFTNHRSPWQRTYRDDRRAKWELDNDWCSTVKQSSVYNSGPRLLDLLDAHVYDYLIGNADRHHYETFTNQTSSMIVMLDNAKSFGNPTHDEASILTPIRQCCNLRLKTWERLQQLQHGVLSSVMRHLLVKDPIAPILTEAHFEALDRRLLHVLDTVNTCIQQHGAEYVLIKDKYS